MLAFLFNSDPVLQGAILLTIIWSLVWTGLALWRAAQRGHKKWFVALLVLNTLGILEIIYLFVVAPKEKESISATTTSTSM